MNPNNGNQVQSNNNSFFGIKVSNPGINVNNATDSQLQYLNNYSQEIFYANGVGNVLIGQRPANNLNGLAQAEEGMFVAQTGVDVRSATDNQLVFNSQNNVFKIVLSGSAVIPTSATNTSNVIVNHNLGYVPAALVYFSGLAGGQYTQMPYVQLNIAANPLVILNAFLYTVTQNDVDFFVEAPSGSTIGQTYTVRYYLMQETAS